MSILYCPPDARLGDVIPFYWKGDYHLFYLKHTGDELEKMGGHPWRHLVTHDFVDFQDWGEALPAGEPGSRESFVATGSVIERDGVFHMFYPGHNPRHLGTDTPQQVVLHATSKDLRIWAKDPEFEFYAPGHFEKHSWGDPFVVFNEAYNEYWMLLAARKLSGPKSNRGLTALAASCDLKTWEVRDPLWAPDMHLDIECPDLFRIGDWWYLVYSGSLGSPGTCYRMSHSPEGPWSAPAANTFDGWMYYAAKTSSDGSKRYAFGWITPREGQTDNGRPHYAGDLVVHEIVQQPDGSLMVRMPDTVAAVFTEPEAIIPKSVLGKWDVGPNVIAAEAYGRYSVLTVGQMPDECLIETRIVFEKGTAGCGLVLRADDTLDNYYQVLLEPNRQRISFRGLPYGSEQTRLLERPMGVAAGHPVTLRAICDGTCLVVYVDDRTALSCRMYDYRAGAFGVFVADGKATFEGISVMKRVREKGV